ncbi:MAG: T9SS type A sorting domain-containing protein, partial [Ignavibacteria bacterium]
FNPVTKIKFSIPNNFRSVPVNIYIYDITGREVNSFSYDNLMPGIYSIDFEGTDLASGVYFYQLVWGDFIETRKMVLLK